MIDIGLSKIIIISVVALVVIGPERLPAAAKALGILWSRFQHYIFKLKQEVNQHISLEEISHLKAQALEATHSIQIDLQNVHNQASQTFSDLHTSLHNVEDSNIYNTDKYYYQPKFCNGRYSWRLKRLNMPLWYKHKNSVRNRVQSGSARMRRFRYGGQKNIKKHFLF